MPVPSPLNLQTLILAQDFKPGDTTFRVFGRFQKTSIATAAKYLVGPQVICFSPFGSTPEMAYINVTTQPTLVAGTDDMYEYTIVTRGTDSDNTAFPPTLYAVANQQTHRGQQTQVSCVVDNSQYQALVDLFTAATNNRAFEIITHDYDTDLSIGDNRGNWICPSIYNGASVASIKAYVLVAGTTNASTFDVYNVTQSWSLLASNISIASGTKSASGTLSATPAHLVLATGDEIQFNIDAVSTTPPKGLIFVIELIP